MAEARAFPTPGARASGVVSGSALGSGTRSSIGPSPDMLMDFGALPLRRSSWYRRAGFDGGALALPFIISKQEGLLTMAAVCDICGKHPGFGMSVSFSHK